MNDLNYLRPSELKMNKDPKSKELVAYIEKNIWVYFRNKLNTSTNNFYNYILIEI